ncbi:hypothetical protein HOY82DRAFT_602471 [Tuber indicum]|nr:hypothetical protein HOY82DRAFT_602471 [Tuber indicum]
MSIVVIDQLVPFNYDKKHQAGWPFVDNFWFSGDLAALPENLAALPGHLTALASVAPRLDPAVAWAPPGFGGRTEFQPDCRPTVWTMVWTGRLGSLQTVNRVDIHPAILDQQLDSIKAIVPRGDRKGHLTVLVTSLGINTAIKEKMENRHIKRHEGVIQYSTPSDEFKCTTVYKATHLGSSASRSSKTRVQEAYEAFVRTQECVLVERILHVHNVEEYLVRKIKDKFRMNFELQFTGAADGTE